MKRSAWSRPSVIVAKEKHGTLYLDATTEENFHASALGLLQQRFNAGYWYPDPDELFGKNPAPDLDERGLQHLIAGTPMHKLYLQQVERGKRWERERRDYLDWLADAGSALKTQDGERAWWCLGERSGAEYENVELQPLA